MISSSSSPTSNNTIFKRHASFPTKLKAGLVFENGRGNMEKSLKIECGVGSRWIEGAPEILSKHPSDAANTPDFASAKMDQFHSLICLQTQSPDYQFFLSKNSECEIQRDPIWQQQQTKIRDTPSSGFQVVQDNAKALDMKSNEIRSGKSLEGIGGVHISVGAKRFQDKLDEYNQRFSVKEKNRMGGALNLLLDAIQLLEDEDQGNEKAKTPLGGTGLETQQYGVDNDPRAVKPSTSNQVSHREDCQSNHLNTSKGDDTERGPKPEVQTKRRRLLALPSRYSDSVLLPWK